VLHSDKLPPAVADISSAVVFKMKFSRRRFLAGCGASSLSLGLSKPSLAAFPHGFVSSAASPFYGNPNVTISAINISPSAVVVTGNTSNNTTLNPASNPNPYMITGLSSIVGLAPGQTITGIGIPSNAVITYVDSFNSFLYMNKAASANGSGVSLTCGGNAISLSRLDGQTPAVFQVSGAFITATGTTLPEEDLQFSWNFGDTSATAGTRTFTRPTDGATVDPNTAQIGNGAAYIYDTAGTYTITLTITGKNGSGYTTITATQSVTVTAFSPSTEFFFDSVNGLDTNNGTSASTPKQTVSAMQSTIAGLENCRLNLANGSSWSGTGNLLTLMSGVGSKYFYAGFRIRNYNPSLGGFASNTTQPAMATTGSSSYCIFTTNGSGSTAISKFDVVASGLSLTGTSGAIPFQLNTINYGADLKGVLSYCYLIDSATSTNTGFPGFTAAQNSQSIFGAGFWNVTMGVSSGTAVGSFNIVRSWFLFFGCTLSGNGTNSSTDHFIYANTKDRSLYKWNNFSPGGVTISGRFNCIKVNYDPSYGTLEHAQDCCISENSLAGAQEAWQTTTGSNGVMTFNGTTSIALNVSQTGAAFPAVGMTFIALDDPNTAGRVVEPNMTAGQLYYVVASNGSSTIQISATFGGPAITPNASGTGQYMQVLHKNVVGERNLIWNLQSSSIITTQNGQTMTIRDNRTFGVGGTWFAPSALLGSIALYKLYRNRNYTALAGSIIQYSPSGFTQQQQITDNVFYNAFTSGGLIYTWVWSEFTASSSIVDRNTFYAPNNNLTPGSQTGTLFDDVPNGAKNFAALKAAGFDVNGTVANPAATLGWTVPPTQWSSFGP
jgi:hypothetical protein